MKRGDLMLAEASCAPQWWFSNEEKPEDKMLVVLVERMPDIDGWRCYSPKYKTNFEFWEFELETR